MESNAHATLVATQNINTEYQQQVGIYLLYFHLMQYCLYLYRFDMVFKKNNVLNIFLPSSKLQIDNDQMDGVQILSNQLNDDIIQDTTTNGNVDETNNDSNVDINEHIEGKNNII